MPCGYTLRWHRWEGPACGRNPWILPSPDDKAGLERLKPKHLQELRGSVLATSTTTTSTSKQLQFNSNSNTSFRTAHDVGRFYATLDTHDTNTLCDGPTHKYRPLHRFDCHRLRCTETWHLALYAITRYDQGRR